MAYFVKGEPMINKDYAYNCIFVGTSKDNIKKVKGLIIEELKKISRRVRAR